MIQRLYDAIEGYKIQRRIKELIYTVFEGRYTSIEQGDSLINELSNMIDKAKEFNARTSSRLIDTARFEQTIPNLELKIEDKYVFSLIPTK